MLLKGGRSVHASGCQGLFIGGLMASLLACARCLLLTSLLSLWVLLALVCCR
jgi:hypothetical protein